MIEPLSTLTLAVVITLLLLSLGRQFTVVGRRGHLLDQLAILPQWKFFGQGRIGTDPSCFDDLCLLARVSPNADTPGAWQDVLWWEDRPIRHTLWNPHGRSRAALGSAALLLATTEASTHWKAEPTALAYLTVLRHCLDTLPVRDGIAMQFCIVFTRGRGQRPVALRFLSAWHTS